MYYKQIMFYHMSLTIKVRYDINSIPLDHTGKINSYIFIIPCTSKDSCTRYLLHMLLVPGMLRMRTYGLCKQLRCICCCLQSTNGKFNVLHEYIRLKRGWATGHSF